MTKERTTSTKAKRGIRIVVVKINEEKCKGCKLCIYFCDRGVLEESRKMNRGGFHPARVLAQEKCTGCGICFLVCPEVAIEIYEESTSKK